MAVMTSRTPIGEEPSAGFGMPSTLLSEGSLNDKRSPNEPPAIFAHSQAAPPIRFSSSIALPPSHLSPSQPASTPLATLPPTHFAPSQVASAPSATLPPAHFAP